MSAPPTRVLVVDDSRAMCEAISVALRSESDLAVVGVARDGHEAVFLARSLKPDVVTMDVQMPGLDGLAAIAEIMIQAPTRILVVCGVDDSTHVDLSFRAIAAGALELLAKPRASQPFQAWAAKLVHAIRLMREVPIVRRRVAMRSVPDFVRQKIPRAGGRVWAVGLAASTGGPPALAKILEALPFDLPVPIFVAQHMSPGFLSGMLRWLSSVTRLRVVAGTSGTVADAGHVYLAPEGHDLWVDREGVLQTAPYHGLHCPSADRLLTSLASAYGERVGAAVLTGMGDDGATGLLEIRRAGGITMAQDEASCVVYGMPRAAVQMGAAATQLAPTAIAEAIVDLCTRASSVFEI